MNGIVGRAVGVEGRKNQVKKVGGGPRSLPLLDNSVCSGNNNNNNNIANIQIAFGMCLSLIYTLYI